jgi:hypothetical protein
VFPGVDLNAPMSVNVGLDGVSPVSGGGAKDTGNYAVGVGAVVYNKYFVDLKYVDSFGKTDKCNVSGVSTGPKAATAPPRTRSAATKTTPVTPVATRPSPEAVQRLRTVAPFT